MDLIENAFTLMYNGATFGLSSLLDWRVATGVAMLAGYSWLARLEVDDVDMRGAKPTVMRH